MSLSIQYCLSDFKFLFWGILCHLSYITRSHLCYTKKLHQQTETFSKYDSKSSECRGMFSTSWAKNSGFFYFILRAQIKFQNNPIKIERNNPARESMKKKILIYPSWVALAAHTWDDCFQYIHKHPWLRLKKLFSSSYFLRFCRLKIATTFFDYIRKFDILDRLVLIINYKVSFEISPYFRSVNKNCHCEDICEVKLSQVFAYESIHTRTYY